MATYTRNLQQHLIRYKHTQLRIEEKGLFHHRGVPYEYDHVLPRVNQWHNLVEPYRDGIKAHVLARDIKLHRYFHHLNSSQAFAFNLFFPFFSDRPVGADALLRALGQGPGLSDDWAFEVIADANEGTNADVAWSDLQGRRTFCEIKLSEQEFGRVKPVGSASGDQTFDARHSRKLKEIYEPVLAGHVEAEWLEPAKFFAHYQILRNVWLAARHPQSRVLFLLPTANIALWPALNAVRAALAPALSARFHTVGIEDVLRCLKADDSLPVALREHARELSAKYVPEMN